MKKLALLFLLSFSINAAFANNLYQYNNPFPQTSPQTMNNLYEAEPSVIKEDAEQQKQEKRSWLRRNKSATQTTDAQQLQTYPVYEGANDGSFYVFK